MTDLPRILNLNRPVFWLIPESPDARGFPQEIRSQLPPEYLRSQGYGVFLCPNELGDTLNKSKNLRHEANVIRFTSVFVDLDLGSQEVQLERLLRFELPPSVIVRTGRGHHAYWLLHEKDPVAPETWRTVQKNMAIRLQGDKACVDPARLMRLPQTWHVKQTPNVLVEIIHLNEQWTYSLSEFPQYERSKILYLPPQKSSSRAPRELIPRTIHEGDRHVQLLKESARYLRGVAPSEISERTSELKSWYAQSCHPLKRNWEAEVESVVEWILKKELGNFHL
jgi:hypothetical protein